MCLERPSPVYCLRGIPPIAEGFLGCDGGKNMQPGLCDPHVSWAIWASHPAFRTCIALSVKWAYQQPSKAHAELLRGPKEIMDRKAICKLHELHSASAFPSSSVFENQPVPWNHLGSLKRSPAHLWHVSFPPFALVPGIRGFPLC